MKKLNRQSIGPRPSRPERILQFGGGNFLRGFIDWIIHHLNQKTTFSGNVVVVKPTPRGNYQALRQQDGLFHSILSQSKDGVAFENIDLIDCISSIIHPYDEYAQFLKTAENPDLNIIVSNTTESGIEFVEQDTDMSAPASSFPGKLTQWLHHRFEVLGHTHSGCIILPCELIERNAEKLQDCIMQYTSLWNLSAAFQDWIKTENHFCNTLVDRIISGYPTKKAEQLQNQIGYNDALLVAGEFYHSWIIEGSQSLLQTLPFDQTNLNVQLVEDLQVHREIKVRILNGLHTAMVPIGLLNGQQTVLEVMQDPKMASFLEDLLQTDILPTIAYPAEELRVYADAILARFRNPIIEHKLSSIALNSISKFRTRLLPSLKGNLSNGGKPPLHICRALAALLIFYRGSWKDATLPVQDDAAVIEFIAGEWQEYDHGTQDLSQTIAAILREKSFWQEDLTLSKDLQFVVVNMIASILDHNDVFA